MNFFKNLNRKQLIALGTVFIAIIGVILGFAYTASNGTSGLLYQKLSANDQYAVEARLERLGVPFSQRDGGIFVPSEKVPSLRMMFAQENIPAETHYTGYQLFDKVDFLGTSTFLNNVNLTRALEGELSRTIAMIAGVDSARVHIVMPKSDYFIKSEAKASASVALRLKLGVQLSKDEIRGITHLVMTAVPNLAAKDITIIDATGKMLQYKGNEEDLSTIALKQKRRIEDNFKHAIEEIVGEFVGSKKISVNVSADLNLDKEVVIEERYDPDGQVVRSQKSADEANGRDDRKNVSVATNIPNSRQQAPNQGGSTIQNKSSNITNYEISKSTINKVIASGQIQKLSVAALVDGKYIPDNNNVLQYTPRTKEELDKIRALISGTIGFDPNRGDKIEVINLPFEEEHVMNEDNDLLDSIQQSFIDNSMTGVTIIIAILLIIGSLFIGRKYLANITQTLTGKKAYAGNGSEAAHSINATNSEKVYNAMSGAQNDGNAHDDNDVLSDDRLNFGRSKHDGAANALRSKEDQTHNETRQRANRAVEELDSADILAAIRRILYSS